MSWLFGTEETTVLFNASGEYAGITVEESRNGASWYIPASAPMSDLENESELVKALHEFHSYSTEEKAQKMFQMNWVASEFCFEIFEALIDSMLADKREELYTIIYSTKVLSEALYKRKKLFFVGELLFFSNTIFEECEIIFMGKRLVLNNCSFVESSVTYTIEKTIAKYKTSFINSTITLISGEEYDV